MEDSSELLTSGDIAELLIGLLPIESRLGLVSKVSKNNPLLGAKCVTACFSEDPLLKEMVTSAALHTIADVDSVHKGNQGLLALIELGEIATAIEQLVEVRSTGKRHVEVITELLICDDGAHVNAYFDTLNPENKGHRKLLLMTVLGLQARLLHDDNLRKRVSDFGRHLVNGHYYTELRALTRRPGFVLETVLGTSVEAFVTLLIEDSSHKSTKHIRLGLAWNIIKLKRLEKLFPPAQMAQVILQDNRAALNLPSRSQLLGLARIIIDNDEQHTPEQLVDHIRMLVGAPGIESLELAVHLIVKYELSHPFSVESVVREFLMRRLQPSEADTVKRIIMEQSLSTAFPDFELLGEVLEGQVISVALQSNKVSICLASMPRTSWMWLSDFVESGEKVVPTERILGRIVTGTVVRIGSNGVELKLVK